MQDLLIDGRYEVVERVGVGGMGEVYLARDEVLNRDVALKVLHRQYANDEDFVSRFKREAQSAASLSHPNIVSVFDQGRSEEGTYYIAMEYVPGGTLKDRILREGALEPREAAGIAAQVAGALSAAHEKGVIHRDIKPQNVLLTAAGLVKVADFGIARAASMANTATSVVLGTASYMSPEQAMGGPVGPRSDLYSLGVVLHEMLTGEQPYKAETPVAVAMKHVSEPLTSPREIHPGVPEGVNAVVVKLLSKDPEDRYRSADELQKDLERVRDGLEPLAASATQTARTAVLAPQAPAGADDETRVAAPVPAAHGQTAAGARRLPIPRVATALLASLVLLGGVAWATSEDSPAGDASGGTVAEAGRFGTGAKPSDARDVSREASEERSERSPRESGDRAAGRAAIEGPREEGPGGSPGVPDTVAVPATAGQTVADAERSLASAGLKVGSVSETPSDAVAAGRIVEQGIPAGEPVDPATPVNLTVNSGPEPVIAQAPGSAPEPVGVVAEPAPAQEEEAPPAQYEPAAEPAPVREAASAQYEPAAAPVQEAAPVQPVYGEDDYEGESEGDDGEGED